MKRQAGATGKGIVDIRVLLGPGGKQLADVGCADVAGARRAKAKIGLELPHHPRFPALGIAARGVVRMPGRQIGCHLFGEGEILDDRDLEFSELFDDGVVTGEGLGIGQTIARSRRGRI